MKFVLVIAVGFLLYAGVPRVLRIIDYPEAHTMEDRAKLATAELMCDSNFRRLAIRSTESIRLGGLQLVNLSTDLLASRDKATASAVTKRNAKLREYGPNIFLEMRPIIEGKLTPESDELAYIKDSLVIDEKSEIEVERRMKIFDAVGDFMTRICPAAVDTKEKTREVGLALGVAFATYFQEEA